MRRVRAEAPHGLEEMTYDASCSSRSWPHAASIRRPRVSRTVTFTPEAFSTRTNPWIRRCELGWAGDPGVGFRGIRFTWAPSRFAIGDERPGLLVGVVRAGDHRPLDRRTAARLRAPAGDSRLELRQRIAPVRSAPARSRSSSVAAWKLTASPTCGARSARRSMPGTMPTVLTVRCRAPMPAAPVSRSSESNTWRSFAIGSPIPMNTTFVRRCGVVSGRLRGLALRPQDLGSDLAGRQVVLQAHLPGRAEAAAHRAPGLRAHADRHAVGVAHRARPRSDVCRRASAAPCAWRRGRPSVRRGPRRRSAALRPGGRAGPARSPTCGRRWRRVSRAGSRSASRGRPARPTT